MTEVNHATPYSAAYRPEIDGLRAFAVLSVVTFHAFPSWLRGGFIGVDVFFVISGYLITSNILRALDKNHFSFIKFFDRRIRRIFPALVLVMGSSLAFGWFALLADEYTQLAKHVASTATFITNFILVEESGYFDNAAKTKPLHHLWSLAVELQFYTMWPLVLWFAWKNNYTLITIMISISIISFFLNIYFVTAYPIETFFWPIGRLWEFLSGGMLAWLHLYKADLLSRVKISIHMFFLNIFRKKDMESDGSMILDSLSFCGLLLLVLGIAGINQDLAFPSKWTLIPIVGSLLIIAGGSDARLNRLLLTNPIAVWFGLISYPLYLWHWPIISYLHIIGGSVPPISLTLFGIVVAIIFAWLTMVFIENPIRKKNEHSLQFRHLFLVVILLGITSSVIMIKNGLPDRLSIRKYNYNLGELKRTIGKERACLDFLFMSDSKFDYCKLGGESSNEIVAVIGDSHAHAAFPGISDGLKKMGFATILLANSSCPPLLMSPWGRTENERTFCSERIDEIITKLKSLENLNSVIIFTRGPVYWKGNSATLGIDQFFDGLQRTISSLAEKSVELLYVTENPELSYQARSCLPRPFNNGAPEKCEQQLDSVLIRQEEYRNRLKQLMGIKILDSSNAFCNEVNTCFAVNPQNQLLYADDNHLSVVGSVWQYKKIISPIYEGNSSK